MVKVELTYDDDFAPSKATLGIDDPSHVQTKGARLGFYNHHLISEGERIGTLEEVMLEAEGLGCPHFPTPFALFWIRVDMEYCSAAISRCAQLAEDHPEGSEAWLVLNCYLNAVVATEMANTAAPSSHIGERMLLLGAALRELELVRRNKRDANVRRSQKKSLGRNNEGRRVFNEHRAFVAQEWQRLALEIAGETKLTGSARAKWVATQLGRRHGIHRAQKTIANFLAK